MTYAAVPHGVPAMQWGAAVAARWPWGRRLRWPQRQNGDAEGEASSCSTHVRLFYTNPHRLEEKPRLPKWTGLELDRVRPSKSPVSPSAPTDVSSVGHGLSTLSP